MNWLPVWFAVVSSALLVCAGIWIILQFPRITIVFSLPLRARDSHSFLIPRIGGIVIIPVSLGLLWIFESLGYLELGIKLTGVTLGAVLIYGYGILDERYDLSWNYQLIIQIVIALILVATQVTIQGLSIPFGEVVLLDSPVWDFGTLQLYPLSAGVTIIWVVWLMNVVNWLDGIDGLASSVGGIAWIILMILAATPFVNQYHIVIICGILLGSYLGFLRFNWYPAQVFLGTTGSVYLGYMLAVVSLVSGGKIATSALVFAFPIIDAGIVILQRIKEGSSIFKADTRHFHYNLRDMGFTPPQIVILLSSMSIVFGVGALVFDTLGKALIYVCGSLILAVLHLWINQRILKKTAKKA